MVSLDFESDNFDQIRPSLLVFMPFAAGTLIVHVQDVQAKMSLALISLHYFVMFAKMATAAIVAA